MGKGDRQDKINELDVEVNVTASRNLNKRNGLLYDGLIKFVGRGRSYSLTENSPGGHKTLEGMAEEIRRTIVEAEKALESDRKDDLQIVYHSDTNEEKDFLGSRGYADFSGSYSRRPLTDDEMRKLITAVDRRLRPLFWKE